MAGVVGYQDPTGAGIQAASNTAETYMRLTQGAAESKARVGASEARTKLAGEMLEAQQFENTVRADERQRFVSEREAVIDWNVGASQTPGGAEAAAEGITEGAMRRLPPEMQQQILSLQQKNEADAAAIKDRDETLEDWQGVLDNPNGRYRDRAREEMAGVLQKMGEWSPENPEFGLSPQDGELWLEDIQSREFSHFDGIELEDSRATFLLENFSMPGGGVTPELLMSISKLRSGGDWQEAVETAMSGHPVYGPAMQRSQDRAVEIAGIESRTAIITEAIQGWSAAGGQSDDLPGFKAYVETLLGVARGGEMSQGPSQDMTLFDNRVAEIRSAHPDWSREQVAEALNQPAGGSAGGAAAPLKPTPAQTKALPTKGKPKDMPVKEYKGILTRIAESVRSDPGALFRSPADTVVQNAVKDAAIKAGVAVGKFAEELWPAIEADLQGALKVFGIEPPQPAATPQEGIPQQGPPLSTTPIPGVYPPPAQAAPFNPDAWTMPPVSPQPK